MSRRRACTRPRRVARAAPWSPPRAGRRPDRGVTIVIAKASARVSLASSSSSVVFGQAVTFVATVTGSGAIPTGTVTFYDDGTVLGTVPLNGSGMAELITAALTLNGNSISTAIAAPSTSSAPARENPQSSSPGLPPDRLRDTRVPQEEKVSLCGYERGYRAHRPRCWRADGHSDSSKSRAREGGPSRNFWAPPC